PLAQGVGALPLECDIIVGQEAATVLPCRNTALEPVLIRRYIERRVGALRRVGNRSLRPKLQRLGQGGQDFQLQACARGLRIDACHGALELGAAPGAEILALEEHLRGVYEGDALQLRELALALRELAL